MSVWARGGGGVKEWAATIIVTVSFFGAIGWAVATITDADWTTERSPITGICYEVKHHSGILSYSKSIAPVDDAYCEATQ